MIELFEFYDDINEVTNIKTVRVFITKERYMQWSRKTPTFVNMLQRFKEIEPDKWTEYEKVNHTLLGTLQNWFKVEVQK